MKRREHHPDCLHCAIVKTITDFERQVGGEVEPDILLDAIGQVLAELTRGFTIPERRAISTELLKAFCHQELQLEERKKIA